MSIHALKSLGRIKAHGPPQRNQKAGEGRGSEETCDIPHGSVPFTLKLPSWNSRSARGAEVSQDVKFMEREIDRYNFLNAEPYCGAERPSTLEWVPEALPGPGCDLTPSDTQSWRDRQLRSHDFQAPVIYSKVFIRSLRRKSDKLLRRSHTGFQEKAGSSD